MTWPTEQEESWRLFIFTIQESAKGFFLLVYDRLPSYLALRRRLQAECKQHQWTIIETALRQRLIDWLERELKSSPAHIALIHLSREATSPELLKGLNLARESLYRLPVNIVFIAHEEAYQKLLTTSHDLMTWVQIPYHFAAPESYLPELPDTPLTTSIYRTEQIDYYRTQIWRLKESGRDGELPPLLANLADAYLEAQMYETTDHIYQWLIDYYETVGDQRETKRYQEKQKVLTGWQMINDLGLGVINSEARNQLQQWLEEGDFMVRRNGQQWLLVDSFGRSVTISPDLLSRLALLSNKVATLVAENRNLIKGAGIRPQIFQRLRHLLLSSGVADSASQLRALFVDSRLAPWRNSLPEARSSFDRVEQLIAFLVDKQNIKGENALVLFLHVLSDRFHPDDSLGVQLLEVIGKLEGSDPPPLSTFRTTMKSKELEELSKLLGEKIFRLQTAWDIETSPAIKFQLEQQLAEAKADLDKVLAEKATLEGMLP